MNPKAFAFWKEQVKSKLLNLGIVSTWNDNNEFDIKDKSAVTYDGRRACDIRPELTYLMNKASYEAQIEMYPKLRPFLSTRSGGAKVRTLAQTWSGDNFTSFNDLKFCHFIGLTMSLSGFYFYGHDLGGFTGDMPSRELLLRWLQHGIFEPRFTIHSWNRDSSATMPWSYSDILPSVKALFDERKSLLPYLYSTAYKCVCDNVPMNAPPFLYYGDVELMRDTDSMMVGRDVLVPFVFEQRQTKANVYLPKGEIWYQNGKKFSGGQYVEVPLAPTDTVPYFVRGGTVLPTGEKFTVYPVEKGEFVSEFFDDDGISYSYKNGDCTLAEFAVCCSETAVEVTVTNRGKMPFSPHIELCRTDKRKLIIK